MAITQDDIIALMKSFHDVVMLEKGTAARQAAFFLHPEPRIFIPHGEDIRLQQNYEIHQKLVDEMRVPCAEWQIMPLSSRPERPRRRRRVLAGSPGRFDRRRFDQMRGRRDWIRLGLYGEKPFARAANAPILRKAFDRLVGPGRWHPRGDLGTFPIRFPSPHDAGDAGWHIDVSFGTEAADFLAWRTNVVSKGRALLMLFLFSDVGQDDAPTRLRAGSHLDIARMLAPAGEEGLSLRQLAANGFAETAARPEVLATGEAGTAYLCHPFLVHAAQRHRGTRPRFMAQPPLLPAEAFALERGDGHYAPVEQAIRNALRQAT